MGAEGVRRRCDAVCTASTISQAKGQGFKSTETKHHVYGFLWKVDSFYRLFSYYLFIFIYLLLIFLRRSKEAVGLRGVIHRGEEKIMTFTDVLGKIDNFVAGLPADVYEDPQGYEEISHELARTGEFICLKVKGDSMSPVIQDGDLVVIRSQQDVDSGDIAAVRINGDESTLKQVQKSEAGITLIAYNPSVYPPHFYSNKEIEELPIEIDGKVVEMKRIF